jgi:predicted glycogen debranching enzyme
MSVADSSCDLALSVGKEACRDFSRSSHLEWLDTNHTGAFAMGTVSGVNTRRYHALLIATKHPPAERISVLARLEETVSFPGKQFELAAAQYPGTVQPHGFELLDSFRLDPFPAWRYDLNGVILQKTVCLLERSQSVLVCYEASQPCRLRVRLMLSCRDYHSLAHQTSSLSPVPRLGEGRCSFTPYEAFPSLTILHSARAFHAEAKWYLNNEYLRELERGLDFREDLFSPGSLVFELAAGKRVWMLASIEDDDRDRRLDDAEIETILSAEAQRRSFSQPLWRALDQFRIFRENGQPSLVAGYPWFTDWSRDTLISLPALSRAGFAISETKAILEMLLEQRSQGLLPNRFTDRHGTVEYNTVDATLWFFVAAHDYIQQSNDGVFLRDTLYPAALEIIDWHFRGTVYDIKSDPTDNLLHAGVPGVQLTWMDAKIGDYVVTPRIGKPVEINALWYNALRITAEWATKLRDADQAARFANQAQAVYHSFNRRFWNEESGCLYDVLASTQNDASIRPNQLFSISLPFPLLDGGRAKSVVTAVHDKLLTPVGLRTLAPEDPAYRPRFDGAMASRDSAYHQGTVWPWLIGPFVSAYLYAFGRNADSLGHCDAILKTIEQQLDACCLGSISEVYDAEAPQHPGGCPAQLWSVAQLILARRVVSEAN